MQIVLVLATDDDDDHHHHLHHSEGRINLFGRAAHAKFMHAKCARLLIYPRTTC